jgi:phosphatidylglycerol:prolipoprotein diacylglycerol transferase
MPTLASWLNTLDPVILSITDSLAIRWYGVSYLAGFAMAFLVLRDLAKRSLIQIPPHRIADALMWFIGMTLIGGRLGYVVFYQPSLLWTFFDSFPWWGGIAINHGGMASHGAMAGLVFAAWRVSRGWRTELGTLEGRSSTLHIMDAIALASPFGLFFGRCANFINGELLGRIVTPPGTPGPWWSVQFPHELLTEKHAPALSDVQTQQLLSLAETAAPGRPLGIQLEVLVAKAATFADQLRPLLSSRHPSQLYQAVAEGLVLGGIVWLLWVRPRKPGFIVAIWLMVYGVLRILTEIVRLPDEQFAVGRPLGLSRGQWLSVAMTFCGLGLLIWRFRTPGPLLGGWAVRQRTDPGPPERV